MMTTMQLYQDIYMAVNGICDKTYLRGRPKSVDSRIRSYIVIALPYFIRNNEMNGDGIYNYFSTTAQIEIYVRDKVSSSNPNEFNVNMMDKKINEVLAKFPISSDNISVSRPSITMQDDDGDGFGITIIQADLRTK